VVTSKITAAPGTGPPDDVLEGDVGAHQVHTARQGHLDSAPMSQPITLAIPPAGKTPPINAAAMASNSNSGWNLFV